MKELINEPIEKTYECKSCGKKITKGEYDNSELCYECLNEYYNEFSDND